MELHDLAEYPVPRRGCAPGMEFPENRWPGYSLAHPDACCGILRALKRTEANHVVVVGLHAMVE
jgi:hypothetical protein